MKKTAIPSLIISAILLFYVQPFIARLILPYFGSSSSVWLVCLSFFQILLLGGYLYTDFISKCSPKLQAVVHLLVLAFAVFTTMQIADVENFKVMASAAGTSNKPIPALMILLARTIGPAYFILSTNSPLMQSWIGMFSNSTDKTGKSSIYRLYALSNVGSFIGLFAYPLFVEPLAGAGAQTTGFIVAFLVYATVTALSAVSLLVAKSANSANMVINAESDGQNAGQNREFPMWGVFAIAFGTTFFLMSATLHLTLDIPPIPLLWAVLLGLYLLSFTLGFSHSAVRFLPNLSACTFILLLVEGYIATSIAGKRGMSSLWQVVSCAATLLLVCTSCNAWLYKLRPAKSKLTRFYLAMSVGGAAAGVFSSVIAPLIFSGTPEYPIAIFFAVAGLSVLPIYDAIAQNEKIRIEHAVIPPAITLCVILAGVFGGKAEPAVWQKRDFYGSIAVRTLSGKGSAGQDIIFHNLCHGNTSHGTQMWTADNRSSNIPISYFSEFSGIGRYLKTNADAPERRIGVIGLGAGSIATYGRFSDTLTYYEIAPLIIEVATNDTWFTFLRDSDAKINYVLGDARLSMENELTRGENGNYSVIIGDAFSSDAIPEHLLTLEAFRLYARHLVPGGVIAVNITNRYIDLMPVIKAIAKEMGWNFKIHQSLGKGMVSASTWAFISSGAINFDPGEAGRFVAEDKIKEISPWTDDFHSIWPLIIWR